MSDVVRLNLKSGSFRVKIKSENEDEFQPKNSGPSPEEVMQQKLQEAYEKGLEDGQNAIRTELEQLYNERIEEKSKEVENILISIENNLNHYESDFDNIVINVSSMIAEKILKREIEKHSIFEDNLKESVRKILGANEIIIKLNPDDYKKLNSEDGNILIEESFSKFKFETDERIDAGGCIVETEIGNVDSRISSQINEIKKQLEANFSNPID